MIQGLAWQLSWGCVVPRICSVGRLSCGESILSGSAVVTWSSESRFYGVAWRRWSSVVSPASFEENPGRSCASLAHAQPPRAVKQTHWATTAVHAGHPSTNRRGGVCLAPGIQSSWLQSPQPQRDSRQQRRAALDKGRWTSGRGLRPRRTPLPRLHQERTGRSGGCVELVWDLLLVHRPGRPVNKPRATDWPRSGYSSELQQHGWTRSPVRCRWSLGGGGGGLQRASAFSSQQRLTRVAAPFSGAARLAREGVHRCCPSHPRRLPPHVRITAIGVNLSSDELAEQLVGHRLIRLC